MSEDNEIKNSTSSIQIEYNQTDSIFGQNPFISIQSYLDDFDIQNNITNNKSSKIKKDKETTENKEFKSIVDSLVRGMEEEKKSVLNKADKKDTPNFLIVEKYSVTRKLIWNFLKNYPKWERNGLTVLTKQELIQFECLISHGRYTKSTRIQDYKNAHYSLLNLRSMLNIASEQEYISINRHRDISVRLDEIEKMLHSLILNSNNKEKK